jgi:hypothetical protein
MIAATTPAGMPSSTSATTAPVVGMVEGPDGKHPVCGGGGGGKGDVLGFLFRRSTKFTAAELEFLHVCVLVQNLSLPMYTLEFTHVYT